MTDKDIAKYGKLYCEAAYPSDKKRKFMEILEKGPKMSNYEQENVMGGWGSTLDKDVLLPCANLYFENFLNVLNNTPKEFLARYTDYMIPSFAPDDELVAKIHDLLP